MESYILVYICRFTLKNSKCKPKCKHLDLGVNLKFR